MFTGIITNIGVVENVVRSQDFGCKLLLSVDANLIKDRRLELGCSIACSGICLTLTNVEMLNDKRLLSFTASKETLDKTNLSQWKKGDEINLEFSLRIGDELGGHMVYGHVDGIAMLESAEPCGESIKFQFLVDSCYLGLIVYKGSVTLDGVSLTVNSVTKAGGLNFDKLRFSVNLIPHTIDNTSFRSMQPGSLVNFEVDAIARYIKSHLENFNIVQS